MLRVHGPDATTFLQGQFSNDLRLLGSQRSVYGLWLNHKGRVLADSHIIRQDPSSLWVVSTFCGADLIAGHLSGHLIADEVEIEDHTGGFSGTSVLGQGSGALAQELASADGIVFPGRRSRDENWELLRPAGEAVPAGAPEIGAEEAERVRILSGIPAIPRDLGAGDLPNEGGLETEAVAYSKGCYLGQEIMSRLRTKGRIRRRLVRVAGTGKLPALPAGLWAGQARVGELRSAVPEGEGYRGLALVSIASSGFGLGLGASAPASLRVLEG